MTVLNEKETTFLLHSNGIKCDEAMVKQWLTEGQIKGIKKNGNYNVEANEVYNFLEIYRWEGTAYEKGIDDKTKVSRLLEEINDLKQQVSKLEKEKAELEDQLGIMPF